MTGERIVPVDENRTIPESLIAHLGKKYRISLADNVEEASEMMHSNDVDFVLLCRRSPGITGRHMVGLLELRTEEYSENVVQRVPSVQLRIQRVEDFIRASCEKRAILQEAAKVAFLCPVHLSRVFKRETGRTIAQYKSEARIRKAQQLLAKSDYSVEEIAGVVGYMNTRHFREMFKRIAKCTPSEYRKKQKNREKNGNSTR